MKKRIVDASVTGEDETIDSQDSQLEISEQSGGMDLLIIAIDRADFMENRSATFHFPKKEKGLMTFNILAATARDVHEACVTESGCAGYE